MRICLINDNIVQTVILSSLSFAESLGYDIVKEHEQADVGWLLVDDELIPPTIIPVPSITLDEHKRNKARDVTSKRFEIESSGIILNGVSIATDISDQNRIMSAINGLTLTNQAGVNFKSKDGWTYITIEELQQIATIISVFVQNCFNQERYHHENIISLNTFQEVDDYDYSTNWPSNIYNIPN